MNFYRTYMVYNLTNRDYTLNDLMIHYHADPLPQEEITNEYLCVFPAKETTPFTLGDDEDEIPIINLFDSQEPDDEIGWIEINFDENFEFPTI